MAEKFTQANEATFQYLESLTRQKVTRLQQRFPVSYRRGLVIYCLVISYFVFTLTATWLQQMSAPGAKPITPRRALCRLVPSVDAASS